MLTFFGEFSPWKVLTIWRVLSIWWMLSICRVLYHWEECCFQWRVLFFWRRSCHLVVVSLTNANRLTSVVVVLLKSVLPVMSVYPLKSVVSLTSVDHLAGVASLAIFVPAGSVFLGREVNLRKKNQNGAFFSSLAASGWITYEPEIGGLHCHRNPSVYRLKMECDFNGKARLVVFVTAFSVCVYIEEPFAFYFGWTLWIATF